MPFEGRKLIVAEDNDEIRSELVHEFEQFGFTVIGEAINGLDLIARIDCEMPDLVSIDVVMPEMNGIEALQKIKEKWPELPCILVSVLSGEPKFIQAYSNLVPKVCFVPKPFSSAKLFKACSGAFEVEPEKENSNESDSDHVDDDHADRGAPALTSVQEPESVPLEQEHNLGEEPQIVDPSLDKVEG